ncbi:MAG: MarR family transcriptional regulator [Chloroflexi bacterium]|nr:MarR family transcriptional regulator [Chloroflexota bacterium]
MVKLTHLQGQYVAFIYHYTKLNRVPPAERDIERFFRANPASVHEMILRLEKHGVITREPWVARSIRVLIPPEDIPPLD